MYRLQTKEFKVGCEKSSSYNLCCASFKEDSQWKLKTLKSMDLMCGIVLVLREQNIRGLLLLGKPIGEGICPEFEKGKPPKETEKESGEFVGDA